MRDGQRVFKFRRYGSGRWDWGDDVARVVGERVLDHLVEVEGASLLYVHLGDRRDRSDGMALSRETIEAFQLIAQKYHQGKVWVTTSSRLLTYCALRDALKWRYEASGDHHLIRIEGIESEVIGSDWLTIEDLQGITFEVPEPEKTHIALGNKPLPVERNAGGVTIPFRRLIFPDV